MSIPVQFAVREQTVDSNALIDSGAEGQFLDKGFARHHNIPISPLPRPITALNVDGTKNHAGTITHYTWLELCINGTKIPTRFLITGLGQENMILGIPWLKRTKSKTDWANGILEFTEVPSLRLACCRATWFSGHGSRTRRLS